MCLLTHNVRLVMQMAKLAVTPSKLHFARRAENREWITVQASYFSMEMYNFLLFFCQKLISIHPDFCSKSKHFCLFS